MVSGRPSVQPRKKTAPLKSLSGEIITDKQKQLERWIEHYYSTLLLYSRHNTVTQSAIDATADLLVMLGLDTEPTAQELNKPIDSLTLGRAPGNDRISPDLIKYCKTSLLSPLHRLLIQCWHAGSVPQDMRDSKITTLYKNIEERRDCNNYPGTSLLSVVGKVFALVGLSRLKVLAE